MGWSAALGAGLLLVGLAALPPFAGAELRASLMQAFAPVCHQMPGRSFAVGGTPLAVCHRCIGLYAGLPLAAISFPWLRRWEGALDRNARWVLVGAALPLAIDWSGLHLGLWVNTAASQVLTGVVFGGAVGLYLTRALVRLAHRR